MHIDLDRISFAEWLIELNDCAEKVGFRGNQPFVRTIGQLCWYSDYEAGLSPREALQKAEEDGVEYGADYEI